MRIETVGEFTRSQIVFGSMLPVGKEEFVVKSFTDKEGKTETKVAPDGSNRPQLRVTIDAYRVDENGDVISKERNVTVSVLEATEIKAGKFYSLSGVTWITHYQNNDNRIAVSIVAERLRPVEEVPTIKVKDIAAKFGNSPAAPQK